MSIQQGSLDLGLLRGSVAVITGCANGGIGWGLAKHCAGTLGMDVALVNLHEHLVAQSQKEVAQLHAQVQSAAIQADVASPESMAWCLAAVQAAFPNKPIGAVFANAGVICNKQVARSTLEEWRTTFNVNVFGGMNTVQAFLPVLQARQTPSVLAPAGSIMGLIRGEYGVASYQSSKHAVVALAESLSLDLARRSPQIRVRVVCPVTVETQLAAPSRTNQEAAAGKIQAAEVKKVQNPQETQELTQWYALTPDRHAQQIWDRIAAGQFYFTGQNVRPYVDHDFPFGGVSLVQARMENRLQTRHNNEAAFTETVLGGRKVTSAMMKDPMWDEVARREKAGGSKL